MAGQLAVASETEFPIASHSLFSHTCLHSITCAFYDRVALFKRRAAVTQLRAASSCRAVRFARSAAGKSFDGRSNFEARSVAGRSTASAKSSKRGDQHSGNRCLPATVAAGPPLLLHGDALAEQGLARTVHLDLDT